MSLKEKILQQDPRQPILLYGMTPPRSSNDAARLEEIAAKQIARLKSLPVDGLVLYDIQDEASRTDIERPFPFTETVDPRRYSEDYLNTLDVPRIIYRCTGKYSPADFSDWLETTKAQESYAVFVGAASRDDRVSLKMNAAYDLRAKINPDMLLGGVAIPERHTGQGGEHLRMARKREQGCSYFITQAIYDTELIKNLLSDYYYDCRAQQQPLAPIIFTFATCGSLKTLEFMKWLGVSIPRWLENDLLHSEDILRKSFELCVHNAREVRDFCLAKRIPFGFNIESVSIRKAEIDCSIELLHTIDAVRSG